jgi:methylenetetrahydrofolate--tRNA-(uracil-5-)-methyltransferase
VRPNLTVVGAGLAGCEAAWQAARRGVAVSLVEMKPESRSPAHHSDDFAELVCSNSLRGAALSTAPGLLKEELRRLGSLVMLAADGAAVPAGGALAVDRAAFSRYITEKIRNHPGITVVTRRVDAIPEPPVIIATGPLTDGPLANDIAEKTGAPLHFYDALAPIVSAESLDREVIFAASRYDKGGADYLNCPMDEAEYRAFVAALAAAEEAPVHGFEDAAVFEGCMPVEVMARRGVDTLRFGPLKPVGLRDPRSGARPFAVVQLRAENAAATAYNLVGFQTHLKQPEQRRVFGMIPGLGNAEFLRYGAMHRNSFIPSPGVLDGFYRLIARPGIAFAGQITGVEGYIESAASGLYCGLNMARALTRRPLLALPCETAIGALAAYISSFGGKFQPSNINFGLIPPLETRMRDKKARGEAVSARALAAIDAVLADAMGDVAEV